MKLTGSSFAIVLLALLVVAPSHALGIDSAAGGNWASGSTWVGGSVPGAGADARILAGHSVTVDVSTAHLNSLTNLGTLNFRGWDTVVTASVITVNGTVTHPTNSASATNSSGEWVPDNRVQFVCDSFALAGGGTINLDGKGYAPGKGPGSGSATTSGASHGGKGGGGGPTYGLAEAPEEPGSGGSTNNRAGGRGGGAVKITASGHAAVDGTIRANGLVSDQYLGAGAGGSVWISCLTFGGTGEISVISGAPPSTGAGGGGGRIAIVYDLAAQAAASKPSVRLNAYGSSDGGQPGTLYFSDACFFPYELITGSGLFVSPVTNVSLSSMKISNAWLKINSLDSLVVTNNLEVVGTTGRLDWAVSDYSEIHCGSALITSGGNVYLSSAQTNALVKDFGLLMSVTSGLTVEQSSKLYLISSSTNGGSVKLTAGSLNVASGGEINADGRGYAAAYGPGTPADPASRGGGSYGGGGSGPRYGVAATPNQPGSGAGSSGAAGGGLVWIVVDGQALIDGLVTADGAAGYHYGGGSGGGIWIDCERISGGGRISACGAHANGSIGLGGGGGRIAITYDPAAQAAGPQPTIVFDAGGGWDDTANGTPGSLYFTDSFFYPYELLTGGGRIEIPGFTTWTTPSLTISNCWIEIIGFDLLDVAGDIRLPVNNSWLTYSNAAFSTIRTGGDFVMTGGSRFYLYSGSTNAPGPDHGVMVNVGGSVSLQDSARLFFGSNPTNGGSGSWKMASMEIGPSVIVNANGLGFAALNGPGCNPAGSRSGGSYGGRGGGASGPTYGSSNAPIDAGSGGAEYTSSGAGGGVVRFDVTGNAVINGQIVADGTYPDQYRGAGAGGSIWIKCRRLFGSGELRARSYDPPSLGRGGGGGRIAIWYMRKEWTGTLSYPDSVLGVDGGESGTLVWIELPSRGIVVNFR